MATPIEERLTAAAASPEGFLTPSGVAELQRVLKGRTTEFAQWAQNPMTVKVRKALQDLVLHPPMHLSCEDHHIQYGLSQGLLIALQLVSDPSMLWPGVFGANTNERNDSVPPPMDFSTSLDEEISPSSYN